MPLTKSLEFGAAIAYAIRNIGHVNGAMIIAPIITAGEFNNRPQVAKMLAHTKRKK